MSQIVGYKLRAVLANDASPEVFMAEVLECAKKLHPELNLEMSLQYVVGPNKKENR